MRELNRKGLLDPFQRSSRDPVKGLNADVENIMNLEELQRTFNNWDSINPNLRKEIMDFLDPSRIRDAQTRLRYFAILLNAPGGDPTQALARLKRLKAGTATKTEILAELDARIDDLGAQLSRGRSSSSTLLEPIARERSALLLERNLLDLGDQIEIRGIFTSNAHNQYYRNKGYHPNSAADTFSVDIVAKPGSDISICRGSFAGAATASNLVGGFLTFCRQGNYIDAPSFGSNLAAPVDVTTASPARAGTSRISSFTLEPNQIFTLDQNGPVTYNGFGQTGSGGIGGGVEFMGDRRGGRVTTSGLRASVRPPVCIRRPGTNCDRIFSLQERVRGGGLTSASGPALNESLREVNDLIASMSADARRAIDGIDGQFFEASVTTLYNNNPDLISALNLKRELELKIEALPSARPGQRFPLDAESRRLAEYSDDARQRSSSFGRAIEDDTDFNSIKAKLEDYIRSHQNAPSIVDYRSTQTTLTRSFSRLSASDAVTDPLGKIYSVTQNIGRMDDAFLGVRGIVGGAAGAIDGVRGLTPAQIRELRNMLTRGFPGRVEFAPIP